MEIDISVIPATIVPSDRLYEFGVFSVNRPEAHRALFFVHYSRSYGIKVDLFFLHII